jgi:type I restriction enzyme S subunit
MVNDWRTARIEEIVEKVACGPFGSSIKVSTFVEKGVPVISGQHLHGTRLEDGEYNYITLEHADKLSNANVYPGDVVFTHAGNIGQAAFIPENSQYKKYVLSQRQFYLRPNRSMILPDFVAYYFHSPMGRHRLLANASQTGVPSIARPVSYLKSIEIPIPPLPEQRAIAHILGSLDDKIELNRRMNETLEAMARAIFKSWFVDFDPVRAKAEGRDPGLPCEIAALFPDSFQDSELGEIPRGWGVSTIGANTEKLSKGTTPRKRDVSLAGDSPTIPFLKVRNISDSGEIDTSSLEEVPRSIHEGVLKRSILKTNDILFSIAGTIGRVTILPPELDDSNTNQAIAFIRPQQHGLPAQFIRLTLLSDRIQFEANSRVVQGVQANVSLTVLSELKFTKPPNDVIKTWSKYCGDTLERQGLLIQESRSLASLRDTLLPKLISGELRVPDAEKFVEDLI